MYSFPKNNRFPNLVADVYFQFYSAHKYMISQVRSTNELLPLAMEEELNLRINVRGRLILARNPSPDAYNINSSF